MTEKKQSTVQPQQSQGFNSTAEDELNIIDFLKFLARKKIFILAITSVCTLCSIFYTQSITPVYRATVGLLDHNERFSPLSILEQLDPKIADKVDKQNIKPINIFERFLFNIKSHELKQKVFANGGFQKKISSESGNHTDQSESATYRIKIAKHDEYKFEGVTYDGGTYLELDGYQPKVMLEFLTALVEAAKENVNKEIDDIQRSTVKTRINNLSTQIEELHQQITVQKQKQKQIEKEKIAKKIARFSDALDMAKRMGIKKNNFDKIDSGSFPLWFRYGELALQQKIMSLKSKEEESSKNKNLSIQKLKLKRLQKEISKTKNLSIQKLKLEKSQTAELPLLKFKVATIGKHSYSLAKPNQTWLIVAFGVAFGLFISIFMGFLSDLKQLKAKEVSSAST